MSASGGSSRPRSKSRPRSMSSHTSSSSAAAADSTSYSLAHGGLLPPLPSTPGRSISLTGPRVVLYNPAITSSGASDSVPPGSPWLRAVLDAPMLALESGWPSPHTASLAGMPPVPPAPLGDVSVPKDAHLAQLAVAAVQAIKVADQDQAIVIRGHNDATLLRTLTTLADLLLTATSSNGKATKSKLHARILSALAVLDSLTPCSHLGYALELHLDSAHRTIGAQLLDFTVDPDTGSLFDLHLPRLLAAHGPNELRQHLPAFSSLPPPPIQVSRQQWTNVQAHLKTMGLSRSAQHSLFSTITAALILDSPASAALDFDLAIDSAADLLGVPVSALADILSYAPAEGGASRQLADTERADRMHLVGRAVYHAVIQWVLEFANSRIAAKDQDEAPDNLITLVAIPHMSESHSVNTLGYALRARAAIHLDRMLFSNLHMIHKQLQADGLSPSRLVAPFTLPDPPLMASARSIRKAFPDADAQGVVPLDVARVLAASEVKMVNEAVAIVVPEAVAAAAQAAAVGLKRAPSTKRGGHGQHHARSASLAANASVTKALDASLSDLAHALADTHVSLVLTSSPTSPASSTLALSRAAASLPRHGLLFTRIPLAALVDRTCGVLAHVLGMPAAGRPPQDLAELVLAAVGDTDRVFGAVGDGCVWMSARGVRLVEAAVGAYRMWKRQVKKQQQQTQQQQLVVVPMDGAGMWGFGGMPMAGPGAGVGGAAWSDAMSVASDGESVFDDGAASEYGGAFSDTASVYYDSVAALRNQGGRARVLPSSPPSTRGAGGPRSARARSVISSSASSSAEGYSPSRDMPPPPPFGPGGAGSSSNSTVVDAPTSRLEKPYATPPPSQSPAQQQKSTTKPKSSPARRRWLCFVWLTTFWAPPFALRMCCKKRDRSSQMAWREKVAICFLILLACTAMLFCIVFAGVIVCPPRILFNLAELDYMSTPDSVAVPKDGGVRKIYTAIWGRVYNLGELSVAFPQAHKMDEMIQFRGYDISSGFPRSVAGACSGGPLRPPLGLVLKDSNPVKTIGADRVFRPHDARAKNDPGLENRIRDWLIGNSKGRFAISPEEVSAGWNPKDPMRGDRTVARIVVGQNVYDLSAYRELLPDQQWLGAIQVRPPGGVPMRADAYMFTEAQRQASGGQGMDLASDPVFMSQIWQAHDGAVKRCLDGVFYEGTVDERKTLKCRMADYILLAMSIVMVCVIAVKFLAALLLPRNQYLPEGQSKFVLMQVPCYTEDEESVRRTIESLARLDYDDKRKLMVILCDGNIVGAGQDRPTPRIVLDVLGVDPSVIDLAPALSYESVGDGPGMSTNMAKVYSGLFQFEGRLVPFVVIVKVGKPTELSRPGNRGKRDSQMILMRFLNHLHYDRPMTPLECELRWHIERIIGVDPRWFEYMLMVDADTTVHPESLTQLVAYCMTDTQIVGVCGETKLTNEKSSFATMIQVYEYFISHHLSKSFESIFGTVTCLPGCFCMYRIFASTNGKVKPLLVSDKVVEGYADIQVETLHKKNLLHLGEDRFLTTLILSTFPAMKTRFTPAALAYTFAPESMSVLLSQRRRWINSTVHNLLELMRVKDLCGFCCLSMRIVVLLDLVSTIVQPAMVVYLGYLIFLTARAVANDQSLEIVMVSFILLAAIYGAQAFIFILKREFAHVVWMLIYLLALPVFGFFLPLYSFAKMDDFSWGNTRTLAENQDPDHAQHGPLGQLATELSPVPTDDPAELPQLTFEPFALRRQEYAMAAEQYLSGESAGMDIEGERSGMDDDDNESVYSFAMSTRQQMQQLEQLQQPSPRSSAFYPPPPQSSSRPGSFMLDGGARASRGSPTGSPRASAAMMIPLSPMTSHSPRASRMDAPWPQSSMSAAAAQLPRIPSEEQLMAAIADILHGADLMTVTKKGIRGQLEGMFGLDLTEQRVWINAAIDQVLDSMS